MTDLEQALTQLVVASFITNLKSLLSSVFIAWTCDELAREKRNPNHYSATTLIVFDTFLSSSKLINTFTGHTRAVHSIDYSTFDDCQFICSGSKDSKVCVWDINKNKQIKSFHGHFDYVNCVEFSHSIIIIIVKVSFVLHRMTKPSFWDFKHNNQLQIFKGHTHS
ncbi:WD-repeat protein, partial [Reticulomyxa filosa]